ncbi:9087_t:CDS:1 [Gigaspora margarita]|uniref:9087_t:CDS:1 n=1 Tax=Gigaspora margarita TaxID=4874 RepID=A0ABN7V3A8_GIGMA|nr:9087_t:CDS:1 [Gigaspora margarita]
MPHTIDHYYLSTQASNIVLEPNLEIENDSSPHIFVLYTQCNEINQTLTTKNINNTEPPLQCNPPTPEPINNLPWTPSNKLLTLLHQFESKILYDHPYIPCCYCSILMFRSATQ